MTISKAITALLTFVHLIVAGATPVKIHVRCGGIDFGRLSMQQATAAGHCLATSYATVHQDDESSLTNMNYHGTMKSTEEFTFELLSWWGKKTTKSAEWTATWDCADAISCPDVDDASELAAWENEFVAELLMTQRGAFSKVKTCSFTMEAATSDVTAEPNVDIAIQCDKDRVYDSITINQGTFLAHALQTSFEKTQLQENDATLDHVYFHKPIKSIVSATNTTAIEAYKPYKPYTRRTPFYATSGNWRCRLCPNDDDMLSFSLSANRMEAWQAEFAVILNEGPYTKFRGVQRCGLTMTPHMVSEVLEEENEQSLRGYFEKDEVMVE